MIDDKIRFCGIFMIIFQDFFFTFYWTSCILKNNISFKWPTFLKMFNFNIFSRKFSYFTIKNHCMIRSRNGRKFSQSWHWLKILPVFWPLEYQKWISALIHSNTHPRFTENLLGTFNFIERILNFWSFLTGLGHQRAKNDQNYLF